MKGIKDIFGRMTTPISWKEKLYKTVAEKRPAVKMKKPAAFAAGLAAVMAVSVTVAALTGFSDWGTALKNDFKDGVSAAKLLSGDCQTLDISAENDIISVTAKAFMGDAADSYIIAEARLGEEAPADFGRFGLNVIMYDETADKADIKNQCRSCYYGIPHTDENGETVYLFKMHTVPLYIESALENDLTLTVGITGAVFEKDAPLWRTVKPMDLTLSFTPDSSVIKETAQVDINKFTLMGNGGCMLKKVIFSEYCTRAVFTYTVENEEVSFCETGDSSCRKLLNITRNSNTYYINDDFDPSSCPVKLIADGKQIPMIHSDINSISKYYTLGLNDPLMLMTVLDQNSEFNGEFCLVLSFEPVDFESAESVELSIESSVGDTNLITIKQHGQAAVCRILP